MKNLTNHSQGFLEEYSLTTPIILAPMAGACPPELSIAVMKAGGMGACGALLMQSQEIEQWVASVRDKSDGSFQLNTWIPDPTPARDHDHENAIAQFLGQWGPQVIGSEINAGTVDFEEQCHALLTAKPRVISSIMGLYEPEMVHQMKQADIAWFATVTSVAEAKAAEAAGANVIVAQGMEAGGHRGSFEAHRAEAQMVGLFSLLPAIVDAVSVPVVATGGIADSRGIVAALALGASAVQLGTAFLRTPEAAIPKVWADALSECQPEDTCTTRSFSGRLGRSIRTAYVKAADAEENPAPLPYPLQRAFTAAMRKQATEQSSISTMQAWSGQSAAKAKAIPAEELVSEMSDAITEYLSSAPCRHLPIHRK